MAKSTRPNVGTTFTVDRKIAPGLNAGAEFKLIAWDNDHAIVQTMDVKSVLIDGTPRKKPMPTNHRISLAKLTNNASKATGKKK